MGTELIRKSEVFRLLDVLPKYPSMTQTGRLIHTVSVDDVKAGLDVIRKEEVAPVPCKIGDTVWAIKNCAGGRKQVYKGEVYRMELVEDMRIFISVKSVAAGEWGRTIFGSEEDAKQALREMQQC